MGYIYFAPEYPYVSLMKTSHRWDTMCFSGEIYTNYTLPFSQEDLIVGGVLGELILPNGTIDQLTEATTELQEFISSIKGVRAQFVPTQYPSLYARYLVNKNIAPIGANSAIGNRLLDGKALTDTTTLRAAMEKATPAGTVANLNFIAGPGLWAAKPAGGSDSVTPAWREAYVQYVVSVTWPFQNDTAKQVQTDLLTDVYMEALRELAPDTGSYLNEVSPLKQWLPCPG